MRRSNMGPHSRSRFIVGAALTLSFAGVPFTANAQEKGLAQEANSPEDSPSKNEIVVTATRRSTNLQDTALSVSALSGETLEEAGITSVADALQFVPGVSLTKNQPGQNEFIIRGVGTSASYQSLTGAITNSTVSTYLGQVPVTSTVQKSPDYRFVDLNRIEVLRGPQGTLYGQSAMGGVVRYIPNAPDAKSFDATANSYLSVTEDGGNNYGIDGTINIPFGENLALRAVGYSYNNSGFIDVVGTSQVKDANKENTWGGRIALRWTPSDRLTIDLNYLHNDVDLKATQLISATYPVDFSIFTPTVVTPVSTDRLEVQHRQPYQEVANLYSADILYNFDAFDANLIVARRDTDARSQFESAEIVGLTDVYFGNFQRAEATSTTAELRLASNSKGKFLEWLVGGYFEETNGLLSSRSVSTGDAFLLSLFGTFPGDVVTDSGRQIFYREYSAFGELTFNFTDKLALTVGARLAKITNDYQFKFARGSLEAARLALVGVSQKTSETVDTYRANLSYKINDDILLYTNVASGFRPGGFNLGRTLPTVIPDTTYVSDTLWNYEVGARTSWLDNRLLVNLALYRIDWDNIQLATFDPLTFYTATQNVGGARIEGAEAEISFAVTNELRLNANYSYTDARIVEDSPLISANIGDSLPGTARNTLTLSGDWQGRVTSDAELFARAAYRYVGKRASQLGAGNDMPEYSLVDLRFGVKMDNGLTVAFFADNVTNKIAIQQSIAAGLANFSYKAINRPRTFGVNVGFDF